MQTWAKKDLPDDVKYAHCGARFFFVLRWAVENIMILSAAIGFDRRVRKSLAPTV